MSHRNTFAGRPCAECRRVKHKCDRQFPCSNCVKKGCGDICPDGTNATGEGHKRFWSKTRELRDTLGDLAARIAALEDALRVSHAINAAFLHPLLEKDLLKIKEPYLGNPSESVAPTRSASPDDSHRTHPPSTNAHPTSRLDTDSLVEALGSLSIDRSGRTKYFGPGALASYFLANEQPANPVVKHDMVLDLLPPDVGMIAAAFPLSLFYDREDGRVDRLATLRCFLPSPEETRRYQALYYEHATATICPVPEFEFNEIMYPIIFEQLWTDKTEDNHRTHHCLSVVFLICAIGAMVDPLLPPRNQEGAKYYELACAALFGSRLVEEPTLEAVQALSLAAVYIAFSRTSTESNAYRTEWAMVGMAIQLAQTMGLHRDPGGFDLPLREVKRRRRVWWGLYGHDAWNSMRFSLPPALASKHFDTKWPEFGDYVGTNFTSAWRLSYCLECIEPLQQQMTAVARPSYETIMKLDNKLRTHPVPQNLLYRSITMEDLQPENLAKTFQRSVSTMYRETTVIVLHRNYCDWATDERPSDPLNHPYGLSVIAVYRSAWAVLSIAGDTYEHMPHPASRVTCMTHLVFTSVAALASIITRCPKLTLVPDALLQLDRFYNVAMRYPSAEGTFQYISELRQAAHDAYIEGVLGTDSISAGGMRYYPSTSDVERREAMLARLGGKTRRIDYSNLSPLDHAVSDDGMTQMGMGVAAPLQLPVEEMHPHVMEYLQGLPTPQML